jgi:hypothetical protein
VQELSTVTDEKGQIQALTALNQEKDVRYVGFRDVGGQERRSKRCAVAGN